MTHQIEIRDTVGAHIRVPQLQSPKVDEAALITVKGEKVPMTVRCVTDCKRKDKDTPAERSVWMFVLKKSGDGKILVKHRGQKATLEIGTAAAKKAVSERLEELKPAKKAPKVDKPSGKTTEAQEKAPGEAKPQQRLPKVTAEQKKAKKAKQAGKVVA